jgi:type IV pilus assembly protein PilC
MSVQVRLTSLIYAFRTLGTSLQAGLPIVRAVELAGRKATDPKLRTALEEVAVRLKSGDDVTTAIEAQGGRFPPLAVEMIRTAEQTGALPEVLLALAEHYEHTVRLQRDFLGQITLPILQLIAAVGIVAGLIWLLGVIASRQGGPPIDVLGWGLTGTSGALTWLGGWALGVASLVIAYRLATASLSGRAGVHSLLLRIPVIGHCLQSFAVARFAWSFHLTQMAGLPIKDSLDTSLSATGNGAFAQAKGPVIDDVLEGSTLSEALTGCGLFPEEFLSIVEVAETSGTVPEALHRLSPQFDEQARRSLRAMAQALSWLIWALVAAFIIFVIFSIALWYVGMLDDAFQNL